MENHPIPQDVTGFQFKLVGNMTLKQFGYVGTGVVLAVILFYSPLGWFLKLLMVPFFAILGVSLAFLPIGGRPMDVMGGFFIKALIKPNQFIYQQVGGSLSFANLSLHPVLKQNAPPSAASTKNAPVAHQKEEQLMSYLYSNAADSNNPLDQRESQLVSKLFDPQNANFPGPQTALQQTSISQAGALAESSNISQASPGIIPQQNLTPNDSAINPTNTNVLSAVGPVINEPAQPTLLNQPASAALSGSPTIQSPTPKNVGGGIEFPNVVSGIVKDPRGNVLAGILIEVLNKDNESVRAFKTNALGQFASATQLPNDEFTITFEDPKKEHKFESVKIEALGSTIPPLTVISVDEREELRRSLFGQAG